MFIGQSWQNLRKDSSTTMAEVVVGERGTVVKSMVHIDQIDESPDFDELVKMIQDATAEGLQSESSYFERHCGSGFLVPKERF